MTGGNVIDEDFGKFAVKTQLDNVCKILNGKIHYQDIIDSEGRASKRIIITYKENESSNLQ